MRALVGFTLLLAACKTVEGPSGQGGAGFRAVQVETPQTPAATMFGICWPETASPLERITLTTLPNGDVTFEAKGGASNGTGWCLREIVTSYPSDQRPKGSLELSPPSAPVDLWAALAWVKLLSPSRFGPERGLLDPAPLAAACLSRGTTRGGSVAIEHAPALVVRGFTSLDAERCLEAVLGATAWPAPKSVRLALSSVPRGLEAAGDVGHYFAPETASRAVLDSQIAKETLRARGAEISACWNEALSRRAGLAGARTFRFRTDDSGTLVAAWVASSVAEGPIAADALLDRCIAKAVTGVRFVGSSGDGVYTWVFASR